MTYKYLKKKTLIPGEVLHSIGWPLNETYGGSFLYHLDKNLVSFGFVIGLDYKNLICPHMKNVKDLSYIQKIRNIFEGGRRISYGARALNEGGFQSFLNFFSRWSYYRL